MNQEINLFEKNKKSQNRLAYLDVMRIIAINAVIYIHTGKSGYFLFSTYEPNRMEFWSFLFVSIFSKFAVALFYMVSGGLLLNQKWNGSLKNNWGKIARMAATLLIVSVFYYLLDKTDHSVGEFFISLYSNNLQFHLWYLYAYLALLISLPLIRIMVQNLDNKLLRYMIGVGIFFVGVLPVLEWVLGRNKVSINSNLNIRWLSSTIVLIPTLGYYVEHRIDLKKIKKYLPYVWIVCLFLTGLCGYLTYVKSQETGVLSESKSQAFFNLFNMIYAMAVYMSVKRIFAERKMPGCLEKVISTVGKSTFGVYLLHVYIMNLGWMISLKNTMIKVMHPMIGIMLFCFFVFFISSALTIVLSKIPLVKKLLGY